MRTANVRTESTWCGVLKAQRGHRKDDSRQARTGPMLNRYLRSFAPMLCLVLAVTLASGSALGAQVVESWRGGTFTFPISISVNTADGSC